MSGLVWSGKRKSDADRGTDTVDQDTLACRCECLRVIEKLELTAYSQAHAETIEGEVFKALVKAGAVSEENAVDHRKVDVQRAARTDSGVHAAGNWYVPAVSSVYRRSQAEALSISLKMIVEPPLPSPHTTLASYVNKFLPDQIRMWGYVRTIKSFQART